MENTFNIEMFQQYSGDKYPTVETRTEFGKIYKYIPYNIEEKNGIYVWEYIPVRLQYYNYAGLVDAVIAIKYDITNTIAIISNYLSDQENIKYKQEFDEFQSWRVHAKEFAKKHFNII